MNDSSAYISQVLGPQRSLSLEWMLVLTLVYAVIFIVGAVGNLLVVIVILKFRFMRENMTNLYLCNLAVTDLLSVLAGTSLSLLLSFYLYPCAPALAVLRQISVSFTSLIRLREQSSRSAGVARLTGDTSHCSSLSHDLLVPS